MHHDPLNFEIDVDLSMLLGSSKEALVSSRWYKLLRRNGERPDDLQLKIESSFQNTILKLQWEAALLRWQTERRRAVRAPLLSRVHVANEDHLIACDISLAGLRCSGRPNKDVLDIEFKLPGLAFPVEAKAEVVSFKDANVLPIAGLKFLDIDTPYLDHINKYVAERRVQLLAA